LLDQRIKRYRKTLDMMFYSKFMLFIQDSLSKIVTAIILSFILGSGRSSLLLKCAKNNPYKDQGIIPADYVEMIREKVREEIQKFADEILQTLPPEEKHMDIEEESSVRFHLNKI